VIDIELIVYEQTPSFEISAVVLPGTTSLWIRKDRRQS